MKNLWQDFRFAGRVLWKHPGSTLIVALSLAIGIGANTAIFSVINSVLLRDLPFQDNQRLFVAWKSGGATDTGFAELSIPEFNDWRERTTVFSDLAAMPTTVYGYGFVLTGHGEAIQLESAKVSASFFPTLGASAALGRTFTAEEDRPGAERVVVLSDHLWRKLFHADRGVIDRRITLNGENATIVGVMPPSFTFPSGADLWAPLQINPRQNENRGAVFLQVIGRLKPGATTAQAQAELSDIIKQVDAEHPDAASGPHRAVLTPLADYIFGHTRTALWLLLAASALLLLIACANVANLLLARATKRGREVAVRAALGATRTRLVRQFLTESLLLALLGGAAGVLISFWFIDLLVSLAPADIPRLGDVRVSAAVLGFTAAVTFTTAFLFGLFPALAASRINLNESLKEGSGKLANARGGRRLRRALIVAEISLTLGLLVGAGLLLRTFQNLRGVKLGYDPEHVLSAQLRLSGARYDDPRERKDFYKQLLERLSARGEVVAASAILIRPLEGAIGWEMDYAAEHQSPEDAKRNATANYEVITPDYFRTMNIPLLAGRDFKESDRADVPHVVIISETLAKRLFAPGVDPVGQRLKLSWTDADSPWRTIVGVAGDARYRELQDVRLDIYVPYRQSRVSPAYLTIRTRTNPEDFIPTLRREVAAIDPNQALTGIATMNELVANSLARPRFVALLLSLLAGFTAVLAAFGLYGVISFMVTERTHEIGVRVALGAQRGDVLRLVIGQGLWLVVLGIAIGLPVTLIGARLIASLLYGVGAGDPATFAVISLALLVVAVAASYIPARRATKVDPLVALRYE